MVTRPTVATVLTVLTVLAVACSPPSPPADLLIYGKVWTGDSTRPWAEAVATRGDTIVVVGARGEADRLRGPNTKVLDNGTALVTPGVLIGWMIYLIGILIICILWRRSNLLDERLLGLTILIAVVTVPHLHLHDLTLLIFPLLFIAKNGMSALSQPRLAFIPLAASLFLIIGLLWDAVYFVLPYVLFIALAWLLWYQDRWVPSAKY